MSKIRFLVILLLVAAVGLAFAQEKVKLTVWIHGADSFIGPTEQQNPQDQWYISQALRRFEKANPGVSVELVVPPDQTASHQNFNTAVLAGNAPDVANLWTGQPIYTKKNLIRAIDDLVPAEDLKGIWGWESVRYNFDPKGTLLGYPAGQNQICHMLYNKAIVKAAGLDFEAAPPRTIKDFDAALAKIKATGKTPILVDEAAQGVPWFLCWVGDYWWAQMTGNQQIIEQDAGKKKFADDKGLLDDPGVLPQPVHQRLLPPRPVHLQRLFLPVPAGQRCPLAGGNQLPGRRGEDPGRGRRRPPAAGVRHELQGQELHHRRAGPEPGHAQEREVPQDRGQADVLPELQGGVPGLAEDQHLPDRAHGRHHPGAGLGAELQHRQAAQVCQNLQLLGGQPAERARARPTCTTRKARSWRSAR